MKYPPCESNHQDGASSATFNIVCSSPPPPPEVHFSAAHLRRSLRRLHALLLCVWVCKRDILQRAPGRDKVTNCRAGQLSCRPLQMMWKRFILRRMRGTWMKDVGYVKLPCILMNTMCHSDTLLFPTSRIRSPHLGTTRRDDGLDGTRHFGTDSYGAEWLECTSSI